MQNLYHICAATCSLVCFVLLAGQGDGRTRKHEETSHASSSTETAAKGLFVCGDCCFCLRYFSSITTWIFNFGLWQVQGPRLRPRLAGLKWHKGG